MRKIGISISKIFVFLGIWAVLTSAAVMAAVGLGGENFYTKVSYRVGLEVVLTLAVVAALCITARFVDKRPIGTLGFSLRRLPDLLMGTVLGTTIFVLPLAVLFAMGAARFALDIGEFSAQALGIGIFVCFFNVVTQEVLVRSYIFQEIWAKYGAVAATIVTTLFFLGIHAAPISNGVQGLIAGANILLASLLLSEAYVRTGALWMSIGIHLGWNGLQGPVLGINVTGLNLGFGHWSFFSFPGDALFTGGEMGVEGGLAGLIGPAAGLAIVAFMVRQRPKPSFASAPKLPVRRKLGSV